ncbi:MAG TPA: YraN family protein [Chthoniobacterales bacterium]|nr:YraN family protein [Chthoniobacterales bacterium]
MKLGTRGENLACQFLKKSGYKILYRNFKGRTGGEIDLVCRDRDTLVFVEVKTRTREDFGRPLEAVNREKRNRIARGGLAWLRLLGDPDILFRFDIVEVIIAEGTEPRLEIVQNAFSLPDGYIY